MKRPAMMPCPFCGKKRGLEILWNCDDNSIQDGAAVVCTGCETKGPTAYGDEETVSIIMEEAIEAWNKRSHDS